jgi:capsular exopolysaccharide synthesis family protein
MTTDDNNFHTPNGSHSNGSFNGGILGSDKKKDDNDPDEIDLKQLFYLLWNHKWIIIGTVVVCTIIAGLFAYQKTPIYQSEGSLLISQQKSSLSGAGESDLSGLLSSTYGLGMGSTIANELQVLQSRRLSNKIADTLMQERLMENGQQYPVLFRSYPDDSTMTTQDTVATRIRKKIAFSQTDREADMVTTTFESSSPQEAAAVVNFSMDLYSQLSTNQNRKSASSAVAFLEKERKRIKNELTNVEEQLRSFMNKEQLMQVDAQTEELITRMAELESRKQEARVKLVATNSAIEQYKERLNNIKPGLAEQYADATGPNMTRLQYQLAELEMEKVQLLANNPSLANQEVPPQKLKKLNEEIAVYRKRISELTNNLLKQGDQYLGFLGGSDGNISQAVTDLNKKLIELQVEQQQAQAQVDVIDQQLKEQQQFFDNLPDNMIDLARKKRDVKINEELYLTVSKQYAEMSLWKQTQFGLGRRVDDGYVPQNPIKPNKKLYLLVGFILGGILSVGYVFIREAFNTRIDGVEKLKSYDLPLLSVIPFLSKLGTGSVTVDDTEVAPEMVTMYDTVSPAAESFRRLQNNIIYANPDQDVNTLLVTSATKGEGKSTVTANLGVVLAEAGHEVLVVDTDLRRPNGHNMLGARRKPGLMEVLFEGTTWQEAIQQSPRSRLSILTAGKEPPNPSAVMQSGALLELLTQLQKSYDYVLLDTPPYGIITDASYLMRHSDGVIVASQFNKTTEADLDNLLENLKQVHAPVIGTVLTAFDYEQTSDYKYNTHYYREVYQDYASYQS